MDRNLPATRTDTSLVEIDDRAPLPLPLPRRQPVSVAFLPLALVTFIILAFTMAAWTFLSAAY